MKHTEVINFTMSDSSTVNELHVYTTAVLLTWDLEDVYELERCPSINEGVPLSN